MKKFLAGGICSLIIAMTLAFTSVADFDIDCGQYNVCTFSSAEAGDWAFDGRVLAVNTNSFTTALSTHDASGNTPYTTTVSFSANGETVTKLVECKGDWNPHKKSMCKEVRK